jgi:hypothetical protein
MKAQRYTSVSCGIKESDKGSLMTVQDVDKILDWIEENDAPENMLFRISQIREQLK